MQRIVNGHYADPNSTRDITGITPAEFEFLVRCLQYYHFACLKFCEGSQEEQEDFIKQIAKISFGVENNLSIENLREVALKVKEQYTLDYGISYTFLAAINQPYPGADYGPGPLN